jgi:hypothetical protein
MNNVLGAENASAVLDDNIGDEPLDQRALAGVAAAIVFNIFVLLVTGCMAWLESLDVLLLLIVLGVSFGQIGLLSLWCSLGDAPRHYRIISTMVGVVLSSTYLIAFIWQVFNDVGTGWYFSIVLLAQFVLLQIVLLPSGFVGIGM